MSHEFKRARFLGMHCPAVGLVSSGVSGGEDGRVGFVGINPPAEVTDPETLRRGEEERGVGLWKGGLYGVGRELAGKRAKRGWEAGMEDGVFVGVGLEGVVEELVVWDGGIGGNEWFPKLSQLPWYRPG